MEQDVRSRLRVIRHAPADRSVVLICLSGELDVDTTPLLREAVVKVAMRPRGQRRLVLDLSALTRCDNAGLFTLLGICQALDAVGIRVAIAWTGSIADAAIERAGLRDRLPLRLA
ncbi:STAS domain-containing protein [Streptomyces sp. NPDC050703]|uniref:STAS domain-containing protein n=1 Tax=Streptomyces sp. NPDC050703 TaxID=3157218 RepID=UPI0034277BF3